ncbi:hypothetical protein Ancab_038613 [Ancistrocladus abbreviatus]
MPSNPACDVDLLLSDQSSEVRSSPANVGENVLGALEGANSELNGSSELIAREEREVQSSQSTAELDDRKARVGLRVTNSANRISRMDAYYSLTSSSEVSSGHASKTTESIPSHSPRAFNAPYD